MKRLIRLLVLQSTILAGSVLADEEKLLTEAVTLAEQGKLAEAEKRASAAIAEAPKSIRAYYVRSNIRDVRRDFKGATDDLNSVLLLDDSVAEAWNRRGALQFKLGKIDESVRDFDQYLKLRPSRRPSHWMRGISLYYQKNYKEGMRQFEGYQTYDSNDVENAVWRFLCQARDQSPEAAEKDILKIGDDRRIPMMKVYQMFKGTATPKEVLEVSNAGSPKKEELNNRLFYAHLYIGLYHEATGNDKEAYEHIAKSVKHRIGHYMWEVARVHSEALQQKRKKSSKPQA